MRWGLLLCLGCSPGGAEIDGGPPPGLDPPGPSESLPDTGEPQVPVTGGNMLILLTDDQGTDMVAAYGEHPTPPNTPNIDQLAAEGMLFRNAWATPICSPTRAALLSGRTGRRTGLGGVTQYRSGIELPVDEVVLPEVLRHAEPPYANAALGKWHIGSYNGVSGIDHAVLLGFDSFAGSVGNLYDRTVDDGQVHNFSHWEKIVDGEVVKSDTYATTDTVDDALAQIATLPEPWLIYVAFNAPHKPLSPPPDELVTAPAVPFEGDRARYPKVVEALDTEIGRLLGSLGPDLRARTHVLFLSDNGTPGHAVRPPRSPAQAKDTPFEGGINVPFIVTGPAVTVPGTETEALVHVVDLMPTLAELAGVPLVGEGSPPELDGVALDGVSFVPVLANPDARVRDAVHAEKFLPNGLPPYNTTDWQLTRGERFKILWTPSPYSPVYFDLQGRDDDGLPIDPNALAPDERAQLDALWVAHEAYWGSIPDPTPP